MAGRKRLERGAIVESWLALLEEEPEAGFRGLAARLGCAHTNLYNFFPDLAALRRAGLERVLALLKDAMADAAPAGAAVGAPGGGAPGRDARGSPAAADPGLVVRRYADFAVGHPAWYRLVWFEPIEGPLSPRSEELAAEALGLVAAALAARRPGAGAEELAEAVELGHDAAHGAIAKALSGRLGARSPEELARSAADKALRVMEAFLDSRPPRGPSGR